MNIDLFCMAFIELHTQIAIVEAPFDTYLASKYIKLFESMCVWHIFVVCCCVPLTALLQAFINFEIRTTSVHGRSCIFYGIRIYFHVYFYVSYCDHIQNRRRSECACIASHQCSIMLRYNKLGFILSSSINHVCE